MKPAGWEAVAVGQVAAPVARRENVDDEREYRLMGVRWYGNGCRLHTETTGSELKTRTLSVVRAGDITYNKMWTSKGAFAIVSEEFDGYHATSEYPMFRPDEARIDLGFLGHLMRTPDFIAEARRRCRGSTSRARLNPKRFVEIPILLPPLAEQRKIAEILGGVDEAIEATHAVIDQTRRVKAGLLQELLAHGIDHTSFKQTEIGEIPESWEVAELVDLVPRDRPIAYGVLKPGPFVPDGPPMLRITDVRGGQVAESGIHRISRSLDEEFRRTRLTGGETVISLVGTIGLTARVPESLTGANLHRNLGRIAPGPRLDSHFLASVMESQVVQDQVAQVTKGGNQPLLNLGDVKKLRIPVPPPDEQRALVTHFAGVAMALQASADEASRLARVRTGLMSELLSGRVRVKVDG